MERQFPSLQENSLLADDHLSALRQGVDQAALRGFEAASLSSEADEMQKLLADLNETGAV